MNKEVFQVGDIVEHREIKERASVLQVKDLGDGTQELKVTSRRWSRWPRWWNSSNVVLVETKGSR